MADTTTGGFAPNKNTTSVKVENFVDTAATAGDDAHYLSGLATMDIRHGGQWGMLPRIGGLSSDKPIHEWMNEQSYLKKDVIPILLQPPRYHELMPDQKSLDEAVKALFEVHAKTISGFDASLTVESSEHELGFSGGSMREPTKVTRAGTTVSLGGINERIGNPFEALLDLWIRFGIMDPDLGTPLVARIADKNGKQMPEAWTAEWYSCTALFIEPDPLYRKAVHVWLVSNMYPTANADITSGKDKSAAPTVKELTIEMGGFAVPPTNKRLQKVANTILDKLKLWKEDPDEILLPATEVANNWDTSNDMDIRYEGVVGQGAIDTAAPAAN